MPYNSRTSSGCSTKIANKSFVCPIPLLRTPSLPKFTRETLENIMYLNALGQPIIVLNSLKSASELLDRRTNIYSDRPRVIVGHEILCGGLFSAFMPYGDVFVFTFLLKHRDSSLIYSWRRHRRAAHEALTKLMVCDYHPTYRKE